MRIFNFRSNPEYCTSCGSAFIPAEYSGGFRRDTGKEIIHHWSKCPNSRDYTPTLDSPQVGRCFPRLLYLRPDDE